MAKHKNTEKEVKDEILLEEVVLEDVSFEDDEPIEVAEEPKVEKPKVEVKEPKGEYQPNDIVEFYNQKGELRYAPYAYITKRGYEALRKYKQK